MRSLPSIVQLPLLLVALSASSASGQVFTNLDPGASVRTRADLERLLDEYAMMLESPAYSQSLKRSIRADAERIRTRLTQGDFRVGDNIVLYVQGETTLPDTVPVEAGPIIALPLFGEIPLAGVLRSEISDHLTRELSRFIRDPVVRASALMRLSVQGSVGRPGFYTMPADMLLGPALMVAGGPSQNAEMDDIRIERGSQTLLSGETLQEAIREGLTLDQLNLQAGDQIVVPAQSQGGGFFRTLLAITGAIGSLSFILWRVF